MRAEALAYTISITSACYERPRYDRRQKHEITKMCQDDDNVRLGSGFSLGHCVVVEVKVRKVMTEVSHSNGTPTSVVSSSQRPCGPGRKRAPPPAHYCCVTLDCGGGFVLVGGQKHFHDTQHRKRKRGFMPRLVVNKAWERWGTQGVWLGCADIQDRK